MPSFRNVYLAPVFELIYFSVTLRGFFPSTFIIAYSFIYTAHIQICQYAGCQTKPRIANQAASNATSSPSNIHVICGVFLEFVRLIFIENPSGLSNSSPVLISLSKLHVDGLNRETCLLGKSCSCRLATLNYFVNCKLYSSQLLIHFIPKLFQSSSPIANWDKVIFFFFTGMPQALEIQCLIVFNSMCFTWHQVAKITYNGSQKIRVLTVGHFYVCS